MGFGKGVGHLLVRDAGQNQLYIHASFGGIFQRSLHFPVQNQVGGHDMHIIRGPVQDIHIHGFTYFFRIQRAVAVGDYISVGSIRRIVRPFEKGEKIGFLFSFLIHRPHLQKHQRKAFYCASADQHRGVFPVAEADDPVDVFIRQVKPAGKGGFSVNDNDFAVISVIISGRDKGIDRRKSLRLDAVLFQQPVIILRQREKLAEAVVQHAHVYSGLCFLNQYFQHFAPHISLFDQEEFQKDIMFRFSQFLQQCQKGIFPLREVNRLRIPVNRKAPAEFQVSPDIVCPGTVLFQFFPHALRLHEQALRLGNQLLHAPFQHPVPDIRLGK